MKYQKRTVLAATPAEIWSLVEDIPSLATCVPGLVSFEMRDARHFTSVVALKVGPVQPRFELATELLDLVPERAVTVISEGRDRALDSRVRHRQVVTLDPVEGGTALLIDLELQISGRVATFGQRIIATKAEEFATEVLANVERLLAARRSG
jgi:carbon monoxide dehydrogenase subunit G